MLTAIPPSTPKRCPARNGRAATRDNTMPHFIAAVNAGATVGEVCNMWRKVYGEYEERVVG